MKIINEATPTKKFSELEKGEVFRWNENVYMRIIHCFSTIDIEDYLDYEDSMYNVNDLIDGYSGFNAVNLSNGNLTFFDDFAKVTPLTTELHIL